MHGNLPSTSHLPTNSLRSAHVLTGIVLTFCGSQTIHPPAEPRCISSWPCAGPSSHLNPALFATRSKVTKTVVFPWVRRTHTNAIGMIRCLLGTICIRTNIQRIRPLRHDSTSLWDVRFVPGARGSISLLVLELAEQRSIAAPLLCFIVNCCCVLCLAWMYVDAIDSHIEVPTRYSISSFA